MKRAGFLKEIGEEYVFDNVDEAISELSKIEKNP
jgi:hypothetical protein